MQAIEVSRFGGPEVLQVGEVADPVAGPGQVVLTVVAAGVLSLDLSIREGDGGEYFPIAPPYTPGAGVAGVVRAVGSGVPEALIGGRVLANVGGGGYAEQVVTEVGNLITVPGSLGLRAALPLLHDGSSALAVFERVPARRGETVLVQPAGGGLGSYLVQLARDAGATVVAAARGAAKLALATELGADHVVDYGEPDWPEKVRATVGGVDVAYTGVGGALGSAAFELVNRGGRFSNYGFAGGGPAEIDPAEAAEREISVRGLEQLTEGHHDQVERIERTVRLAVSGTLRPLATTTFPLAQAAQAHAALAGRDIVGKAVLIP